MSFEENFKEAVKRFLERQGLEVCTVTDFHERYQVGGEGDVYTDEYNVVISYLDKNHNFNYFRFEDSFSALIRELTLD